ncbi:MAG TPA: MAE_28990/MAE_18760 family HEPN-like nuclease [Tepidisphaeraceae bacterium]|jgi:hypothetical protein
MTGVQADFKTRAEEVNRYFRFLREFEAKRVVFQGNSSGKLGMSMVEQAALFKTLKANFFLLLYNLVESTVKNAIEAIFDEFKSRGVSFDECRLEVRKIVLANLKRHNVDKILPSLSALSVDVVATTFRKEELFSGNVDGRRIRHVADAYGFRSPSKKCDQLLTVKTSRNDLAHGNKSFGDIGRDYDVDRLEEIRKETTAFLEEFLVNVADYITTRAYLASPPSSVAVAG